jgi:hypothetical protein
MAEAFRVILLVALAAALLTTLALAFAWWMEPPRRMRRALLKALAAPPEVEAMSVGEGKACALNFDMEQVVVLWASGGHGLAYAFEEVDGGEIIVVADAGDHRLGACRRSRGRIGDGKPGRLRLCPCPVIDGDLMAGARQRPGHGCTHDAGADESDPHARRDRACLHRAPDAPTGDLCEPGSMIPFGPSMSISVLASISSDAWPVMLSVCGTNWNGMVDMPGSITAGLTSM